MATSNFMKAYASKYYVVDFEESYDYDFHTDEVTEALKQGNYTFNDNVKGEDYNRSYPSNTFLEISKISTYHGLDICATAQCMLRSGYYGGANYDYILSVSINGDEIESNSIEDVSSAVEMYMDDDTKYITKMAISHFAKVVLDHNLTDLSNFIEKVYSEHSTSLCIKARFSNGETIYEEVA